MSNNIDTIILVPVFILLAVIVFKPIKSALNIDTFPSCVLSVCVSVLCVIGMSRSMKGTTGTILLPYAALGITMILLFLLLFIVSIFKRCSRWGKHSASDEYSKYDKHQKLKPMKNRDQ
jgi:hypothetical protein